jgi:hypothetical protein
MKFFQKYRKFFFAGYIILIFIKPAFFILLLGAIVLFYGAKAIYFLKKIEKKGIQCYGRIVSMETSEDGYKTPVVEFTTLKGDIITSKPSIHFSTDIELIMPIDNESVPVVLVLYDPDAPNNFMLSDENGLNYSNFGCVLIFIVISLVFIFLGIYSLLGYIKIG